MDGRLFSLHANMGRVMDGNLRSKVVDRGRIEKFMRMNRIELAMDDP